MICNSKQTNDEPSHGKMKRLYIRVEKDDIRTWMPVGYMCPKCKNVIVG